jgi:hypothetical protein
MEVAMGEYQTDAGPMDALRTHLKAVRTASARIDPTARRVAVLERLPERIAALTSRVSSKLEARESQSADDSTCAVLVDIAVAAYEIAADSTDPDEVAFWEGFGESVLDQADECYGGG